MKAAQRMERLRALMAEKGIDAYIVRDTLDLMWLTGFEEVFDSEEAHTAVITGERSVLHSDSRYSTALREAAAEEGLWDIDDAIVSISDFVAGIAAECGLETATIAIDSMTPLALYRALVKKLPEADFAERGADIVSLRSIKEPIEIERMREAQAIASAAFEDTLTKIHAGMTEREVSLMLEFAMRERGAEELAFPNIVASGPNSANPHSVPGSRALQRGDLVVIDFGARYKGYRSDTTRTICIGAPSEEQQRIYNAVRRANEEVERVIGPDCTGKAMHELAESILAEEGFAGKMGHGLGHGVGIDIHESPNLSPRNEEKLEVGSVVTVEPGVYIAGENGVRLEDYGVITENGFVNLCGLTHELRIVE